MIINLKKVVKCFHGSGLVKVDSCDDIELKHAWKTIELSTTFLNFPPTYFPSKRKCINCGKAQELVIVQNEIKEWKDS